MLKRTVVVLTLLFASGGIAFGQAVAPAAPAQKIKAVRAGRLIDPETGAVSRTRSSSSKGIASRRSGRT